MELLNCLGLLLGGLGLVLLVLGLFSPRGHDTKHDELLTFLTGDPAASAATAVVGMALSPHWWWYARPSCARASALRIVGAPKPAPKVLQTWLYN